MLAHRKEARNILEALGYVAKKYDPDGVDMAFTQSSEVVKRSKTTEKLLKAFDKAQFTGKSDMRVRLADIFEEYKRRSSSQQQKISVKNVFRRQETQRRLSVYILTNGIWQPGCDVETPIRSMVNYLQGHDKLDKQVGIQFIQFGDDQDVKERFKRLDTGLNVGMQVYPLPHSL